MGRKVWVVPANTDVTDDVVATATAAGAEEIACGVPASLQAYVDGDLPTLVEEPDVEPPVVGPDRLVVLAGKVDDGGLSDSEVAEAVGLLLKRLA